MTKFEASNLKSTERTKLRKRPQSSRATARLTAARSDRPSAKTAVHAQNPEPLKGPPSEAVTKHDKILALLSRGDGATLLEMMEMSGWQKHSVRGFLAGTVKKRHGFMLTSSKVEGELRRYRIERGR
jgi:hypothetical protein